MQVINIKRKFQMVMLAKIAVKIKYIKSVQLNIYPIEVYNLYVGA